MRSRRMYPLDMLPFIDAGVRDRSAMARASASMLRLADDAERRRQRLQWAGVCWWPYSSLVLLVGLFALILVMAPGGVNWTFALAVAFTLSLLFIVADTILPPRRADRVAAALARITRARLVGPPSSATLEYRKQSWIARLESLNDWETGMRRRWAGWAAIATFMVSFGMGQIASTRIPLWPAVVVFLLVTVLIDRPAARRTRQQIEAALRGKACAACSYDLSTAPPGRVDHPHLGPRRCPECGARWPTVPPLAPPEVLALINVREKPEFLHRFP